MAFFVDVELRIKFLRQWLQLARIYNARSMMLFFLLGQSLSRGYFVWQWNYLWIFGLFIVIYAVISFWNYVVDERVDVLNQRENLIQQKVVSVDQVMTVSYGLIGVCLWFSLFFNLWVVGIGTVLLLALGWLYSIRRWSYHPWGKILIMVCCYALVPGMMGLLYGGFYFSLRSLMILCLLSLFYGSWLLYSDVKDIEGDRQGGKQTLAVVLGVKRLSLVAVVLGLSSIGALIGLGMNSRLVVVGMGLVWALQVLIWKKAHLLKILWLRRGLGYLLLGFLLLAVFETW